MSSHIYSQLVLYLSINLPYKYSTLHFWVNSFPQFYYNVKPNNCHFVNHCFSHSFFNQISNFPIQLSFLHTHSYRFSSNPTANYHEDLHDLLDQTKKLRIFRWTLENTEGAIKNGQSRETGNIRYTRHRTKTKQKHMQTNTNKANKTPVLLQTPPPPSPSPNFPVHFQSIPPHSGPLLLLFKCLFFVYLNSSNFENVIICYESVIKSTTIMKNEDGQQFH